MKRKPPPEPPPMPSCCTSLRLYREWYHYARSSLSRATLERHGICIDCTPKGKKRMMELGKCDHPNVVFVEVEETKHGGKEIVGRRPENYAPHYFKRLKIVEEA